MDAYETESSIAEGLDELERLFEHVRKNAKRMEAHEVEEVIFILLWVKCVLLRNKALAVLI